MIYWSLQQTAKFNNKACLILHLIAAASNIYLEQQEGSRESQYKVHIIGFFPQQCAHTLKVFCFVFSLFVWFWRLLSDLLHTI